MIKKKLMLKKNLSLFLLFTMILSVITPAFIPFVKVLAAEVQVAAPIANPDSGTYGSINVTLTSATTGSAIYYTTNNTTPSLTSTKYTTAIAISANTTISAISVSGSAVSSVATYSYHFDGNAKNVAPVASSNSGKYSGTQTILLTSASVGTTIYYTKDGTTPTKASSKYNAGTYYAGYGYYGGGVTVDKSMTIKAVAIADGSKDSDISSYTYVIIAPSPTANMATGSVIGKKIPIKLSATTTTSAIYFTTDGTDPTKGSLVYSTPIPIDDAIINNNTITIKTIVADSTVATYTYTVDNNLVLLSDEASIPTVISEMTLMEKATMLGGSSIQPLAGAAGSTQAIPRLNIIGTSLSDGPAGIRITTNPAGFKDSNGKQTVRNATWWANGAARAATWNTSLEQQMGSAWGKEMYFFGNDILLGPGTNIHRYALNGRNFEYYSEDPLLAGMTGVAEINGIQSEGVGATIKHYAANNQENGRSNLPETIGTRALREIYLRAFEYVVEGAQPWSIMSSYNQINGVSTAESPELMTSVLRTDFGFKGFAMTDWGGQGNASYWPAQTGNNAHSSLVKAGVDLCESSGNTTNVIAGYNAGFITMADIDACVTRILKYVIKTPAFKTAGMNLSTEPSPYTAANLAIADNIAIESMSVLKNDTVNSKPALPITGKNIVSLGTGNVNMVRGGSGSGSTNAILTNSLQLPASFSALGKTVIDSTSSAYSFPQVASVLAVTGMGGDSAVKEIQVSDTQMTSLVNGNDAVVMTLRRGSAEGGDITATKGAYYISDAERALINTASTQCRAIGVPFIVVMNMGAPIEIESWKDKADAILFAWEPGIVLGKPVAEVLTGIANPSGKLSTTFPVDVKGYYNNGTNLLPYSPAEDNFGTVAPTGVTYDEGIYVGYRYYDKYKVPVSYEFGYGKNYSTFDYSNLKLDSSLFTDSSSVLNINLDIKNTSIVTGKEVAELYVGAPGKSMDKPVKELKGFAKTNNLSTSENQTLNFKLDAMSLASFDEARSAWIVEPGTYSVYAAASSKDIRQTATFTVPGEIVVKAVSNVLKPNKSINLLNVVGKVASASQDATLSDIKVDGTTVTSFNAATLTYNIELVAGTTLVPTVTVTTTSASAIAAINKALSLPGATTVVVTSQDGTTKSTYTINFTVASSGSLSGSSGGSSGSPSIITIPVTTTTDSDSNIIVDISPFYVYPNSVNVIKVEEIKTDGGVKVRIPVSALGTGTGSFQINTGSIILDIPISVIDPSTLTSGTILQVTKSVLSSTEANTSLANIPQGAKSNGKVFNLSMEICDSDNKVISSIHSFASGKSVGVTLNLSSDDIKGMDTSNISAFYYDATTKTWVDIGGSFDITAMTYAFSTTHFTNFTILQKSAITSGNVKRLAGQNRIETSIAIAKEEFTDTNPDAVVLTTANDFPDALTGSGLAYKYNAPLLLVNKSISDSQSVIDYINGSLSKGKNIYVLGGITAVSSDITDYLTSQNYNIVRISGENRYETNQSIFESLNVSKGTPMVIATGDSFADALSISSIADIKGYPILLNGKDTLSANVSKDITNIQPTTIYIVGGTGVLSTNIEAQIQSLNADVKIVRLGGKDRYETSMMILDYFKLTTNTITVATGIDFPDALSGAVLAARKNSGILLVNNNGITEQKNLLIKENITTEIVLGGEGVISNSIANSLMQK